MADLTFFDIVDLADKLSKERTQAELGWKFLIYGKSGAGKSRSLVTAPRPIYVDVFDPGGEKALRKYFKPGEAIFNTTFQYDDPLMPSAYLDWHANFKNLDSKGFFNHVGTYALDSVTTFAKCVMHQVLRDAKRPGKWPQQNDYSPQITYIEQAFADLITLPCNVVVIAHEDMDKDEFYGYNIKSLSITKSLRARLPILFDEIYYATYTAGEQPGTGTAQWQTGADAATLCKSRIADNGKLPRVAMADFKKAILMSPYPEFAQDKPSFIKPASVEA